MIAEHRQALGTRPLCEALAEPRSSYYRSLRVSLRAPQPKRRSSPRSLTELEQNKVVAVLNSDRFRDTAPPEVHATLLDEGTYLASVRTMYRILTRLGQSVQRRQKSAQHYARPELLATRPNQLWSWDITKLLGPTKWTYYYLYKILDVFSRYVVGWMVAHRELARLAEDLIAETCLRQGITPGELTIHADRGSSMRSQPVAQLLADLGVTKTHSRPHVSNDNPYSESAFKTLKYRPDFPERFGAIEHSRSFCGAFFDWYNNEHHHSGIAMLTPASVHYGTAGQLLQARAVTLVGAYLNHPERFVKGIPKVQTIPEEVWINKPMIDAGTGAPEIARDDHGTTEGVL
jgi:putative transposase